MTKGLKENAYNISIYKFKLLFPIAIKLTSHIQHTAQMTEPPKNNSKHMLWLFKCTYSVSIIYNFHLT